MNADRGVTSVDSVMWRHCSSSRFCSCLVYQWSNRNSCRFIISLWIGLFHVGLGDFVVDCCSCWQKPCSDTFFCLQATLQTSPAGHTTSFQMFNNTYKLYSYRLVVGKSTLYTQRLSMKPVKSRCFAVRGPYKWVLGRSGETWATILLW